MADRQRAHALEKREEILRRIGSREPSFFLDLDGTLTPIVSRPSEARLTDGTRRVLEALSSRYLVCFLSGRDLEDLVNKAGVSSAYYAADHGHRVRGPRGSGVDLEIGAETRADLASAAEELTRRLAGVPGALVEPKDLSVAVHHRLVAGEHLSVVSAVVGDVALAYPSLRLTEGKSVYELLPGVERDKGAAMLWLLSTRGMGTETTCPICLGDDLTDEDTFSAARGSGITIVVGEPKRPTGAEYLLEDFDKARAFLASFVGSMIR